MVRTVMVEANSIDDDDAAAYELHAKPNIMMYIHAEHKNPTIKSIEAKPPRDQ